MLCSCVTIETFLGISLGGISHLPWLFVILQEPYNLVICVIWPISVLLIDLIDTLIDLTDGLTDSVKLFLKNYTYYDKEMLKLLLTPF